MKNITILGGGVLGSQIAFQTCYCGYNVTIYLRSKESVKRCKKKLEDVKKSYIDAINMMKKDKDINTWSLGIADFDKFNASKSLKIVEEVLNKINFEIDLEKSVCDADLVIESMSEDFEAKKEIYQRIASLLPEKTILVTNSSTMLPSKLAKFTKREDKFLALHFANSIWKNNTAEVMTQPQTDMKYFDEVMQFANDIRMIGLPVRKEKSGYLLNSMLVPFLLSGLDLYASGISDPESIDIAWTRGTGAPKGPFQIFDTVGLNTAYNIVHQYHSVPGIFSPLLKKMMMPYNFKKMEEILKKYIDEGKLGMSTGEGFYKYK